VKHVLFVILAVLIVAAACLSTILMRDMAAAQARLICRSKTTEMSFGTLEYAMMG
jgi:hypothetical protein